jgi:hypothetical protein
MKFVTTFPLSGNGTDFREFGYTGSSDDISGCWMAVTICVSGARHNIKREIKEVRLCGLGPRDISYKFLGHEYFVSHLLCPVTLRTGIFLCPH